jgi:nucleoside phosphorylase
MDADGLTLACATTAELRAARRARARSALVGLGASNGVPDGPLVSFGLAGALRDDLPVGTVLDATRVVAADGAVLWEGDGLRVPGGTPATILAADRIVDSAAERRSAREASGADAVDLESGPLARTGRLQGVLRVVSDTPQRPLGALAGAVRPDDRSDWRGVARGVVRSPRAAVNAARAVGKLGAAAKGWDA